MSRYTVTRLKGDRTDDEAVIGFDPPLRTFFLQGFEADDDFGTPEIWLGTLLEEFPTMEGVIEAALKQGYEVRDLDHAEMIALLAEAATTMSRPSPRSLALFDDRAGTLLFVWRGTGANDRFAPAWSARASVREEPQSPSPRLAPLPEANRDGGMCPGSTLWRAFDRRGRRIGLGAVASCNSGSYGLNVVT